MGSSYDVQYDDHTLILALGLAAVWLLSVRLCFRSGRRGWTGVLTSFIGLTWISFGLHFLMRFAFLSWDAETYGATNVPMWSIEPSAINRALGVACLYWVVLCTGYAIGVRRRGPGLLTQFRRLEETWDPRGGDTLAVISGLSLFFFGAQHVQLPVPGWAITPLGLLGALWPIPAAVAWGASGLDGDLASRWRARRFAYLIPGVLMIMVVPYRERMFQFLFVPILASIAVGRHPSLKRMTLIGMVVLLLGTVGMTTYRKVLWERETWAEATTDLRPDAWNVGTRRPPWVEVVQRIHGFDSLVLTVAYVPLVFPFDGLNIFRAILIQLIPRAVYPEKPAWTRSADFSVKIWGYGLPQERLGTKIAPSMAGDLYAAGGFLTVIMGALSWGLIVGVFEGWKDHLRPVAATMVLVFWFISFPGAVERDIVLVVASSVQNLIAFLGTTAVIFQGAALVRARPADRAETPEFSRSTGSAD